MVSSNYYSQCPEGMIMALKMALKIALNLALK
jgi:hypothetical protein